MMRAALFALMLAACAGNDDVVPPTSGPTHRFVVDEFVAPTNILRQFAADLGGGPDVDDGLNSAIVNLVAIQATTPDGNDQVRAGTIASTVEVIAADLDDADASVRFIGFDGASSVPVGGRFRDGAFVSNRTATTDLPGSAVLALPIVLDTDASVLQAERVEMELTPSARGGYDLVIRGAVDAAEAQREAGQRIFEMIRANPRDHLVFASFVDTNADGRLTASEVTNAPTVANRFQPDLEGRYLGFVFKFHLKPCPEGRCLEDVAPTCFDRIANATETDVDCGGPCQPCGDDATCASPADCFSGACTAGQCAAPTCTDGLVNGFEGDADCGGPCSLCLTGQSCYSNENCLARQCNFETSECF